MKETVIQFGSGNFLRGFADHFLHILNETRLYEGGAVIVQSTSSETGGLINKQKGIYNLLIRGLENGAEIRERTEIHSVSRCVNAVTDFEGFLSLAHHKEFRFIISNTTEVGITYDRSCHFDDSPPTAFPAKLTRLLYERFKAGLDGFVIFACELIDNNGTELQKCVLKYTRQWKLSGEFIEWIKCENKFCNTLVDRIVTGYPEEEAEGICRQIGYEDKLLNTAEPYHLWVVEGNFEEELPLKAAGVNVVWTNAVAPYKKRKVRMLNGAHTSVVFPAMLCGIETVKDGLEDEQINRFLRTCLFDCILPTLGDTDENRQFAHRVLERFANPYINHLWSSISLHSVSKFRIRVLPTIKEVIDGNGGVPKPLVFSLACLIEYYKSHGISDDTAAVDFIRANEIPAVLANETLWGEDLTVLSKLVNESVEKIHSEGIREALEWILS